MNFCSVLWISVKLSRRSRFLWRLNPSPLNWLTNCHRLPKRLSRTTKKVQGLLWKMTPTCPVVCSSPNYNFFFVSLLSHMCNFKVWHDKKTRYNQTETWGVFLDLASVHEVGSWSLLASIKSWQPSNVLFRIEQTLLYVTLFMIFIVPHTVDDNAVVCCA